jgi:uncharacterized protein (TIGR03437 family)
MDRGQGCFSTFLVLMLAGTTAAQNVITTIAGVDTVFNGDGQLALTVPLGYVNGVATDTAGNVYFTDPREHLVLSVDTSGVLHVIAGNGIAGYSGDGGPATAAAIAAADNPDQYIGLAAVSLGGIAVDPQGNIYFADSKRVRMVNPSGIITTVAGGGGKTPANGVLATNASLGIVSGVVIDNAGNLYFSENSQVLKMAPGGMLTIYATLRHPLGLALDAQGNLYAADTNPALVPDSLVYKITNNGQVTTVAGGGTKVPATGLNPLSMELLSASGVAVDASGALYVFASQNGYLLKISGIGTAQPTTTLITSTLQAAFASNIPAAGAFVVGSRTYDSNTIAFDSSGNLYIADSRDDYLGKIDTHGVFTAVAGNGNYGYGGDGGPAQGALIQGPTGITATPDGTIYFIDRLNFRVRSISPNGIISSVLSPSTCATLAKNEVIDAVLADPTGSGNVYVLLQHSLLEVTPAGAVTQILVTTSSLIGQCGDGSTAKVISIGNGGSLTSDAAHNVYLSNSAANTILKITNGNLQIVAGAASGAVGISPAGAPEPGSPLSSPTGVLADGRGGMYFEELDSTALVTQFANNTLRYVTPAPGSQVVNIAGSGVPGPFSDGIPAVQANLGMPADTGMALDSSGNLYFADGFDFRVREVITPNGTSNGIIATFAGNGLDQNAGDGGLATDASFITPQGLWFDAQGNLLITDRSANRIRKVLAKPPSISVLPIAMSFTAKSGGALTAPKHITMTSPVGGLAFAVNVASTVDWLVVDTTTGATPQLVDVRVDPTNLAQGSYRATILITSPLAIPVNTSVTITVQVSAPDIPSLSVAKSGLSFTYPKNSTATQTQLVQVSNSGSGSLAFTAGAQAANGGNWLNVTPASGSVTPKAPINLSVAAASKGLAVGTYTGSVTITSSTTGETATVMVTLTVSALDQAMRLSHAALSFTAVVNGGVVPPASFNVGNIGRGTMNFTVSTNTLTGGSQWLSATPGTGTATAGAVAPVVTVTVNPSGLAPGFYYGQVRVDSPAAANTPHMATVALRVLPSDQDPGPVIVPSEIVVTAVQGAPPPGAMDLFVYNVSATPQTFVSTIDASNPNDKFSFIPQNGTISLTEPARMIVQPLTSGLAVGVYNAMLTLQFSDGNVRRVGIRTIITPAPVAPAAIGGHAETPRDAGCTASQLVPVITVLGQSFSVPAAWPVALQTTVNDDCGNTLDSGSVKVSFSNGDAPLSLQPDGQGGSWNTTWVSGNNSGPVTLTVTANDPTRNLTGTREVTGGLGDPAPAPVVTAVVSSASFARNTPLAPGSIISLGDQNLSNGTAKAQVFPLGATLADATVVMGNYTLPLYYSSTGLINAVAPAGISINTSHQIVVQRGTTLSVPITVDVGPAEPAIFTYPLPDAPNQGTIVNALTYVVAQPGSPVTAGDPVAIFCTGLGAVDQTVPDGVGAPSPPANTVVKPTVTIGGQPAHVDFSGLTPGLAGLYQINVILPTGITPGNQVPVVISIDGQTGPALTMAVK